MGETRRACEVGQARSGQGVNGLIKRLKRWWVSQGLAESGLVHGQVG